MAREVIIVKSKEEADNLWREKLEAIVGRRLHRIYCREKEPQGELSTMELWARAYQQVMNEEKLPMVLIARDK